MSRSAAATRDWRDTFSQAADLALLGILVTIAALPVLTAGAAVAVAAEAIAHRFRRGHWPGPGEIGRALRRRLLPGLAATALVLLGAALLLVNAALLDAGLVPGGDVLLPVTTVIGAGSAGLLGLSVAGLSHGLGFTAALRAAGGLAAARPLRLLATAGVLVLAAALALLMPLVTPILLGYVLFALYAIGLPGVHTGR